MSISHMAIFVYMATQHFQLGSKPGANYLFMILWISFAFLLAFFFFFFFFFYQCPVHREVAQMSTSNRFRSSSRNLFCCYELSLYMLDTMFILLGGFIIGEGAFASILVIKDFLVDRTSLKLVDKFTYLESSVSSTEKDINTRLTKAWTAIDKLSIIWKSDLTDKMKRSFFQAEVVSILLYGYTTWTLTKRLEKKLDGNYTRMLRAIVNKSWRQHPTRHQLYDHLPPIAKTIQVERTRHSGHCWRSRDELISDLLLWAPTYGRTKAGRPARTYIQQLCEDKGCSPEDLPETMNDRKKWREKVRDVRVSGTTW